MDTRRFDKNADQLVQILAHINTVPEWKSHEVLLDRHYLMRALETCIALNDKLGKMAEKGLI